MASSELHACKQTAHSLSRPRTRFLVRAMEAAGERLQSKFGKTSSCHLASAGRSYLLWSQAGGHCCSAPVSAHAE